MDLTLYHYWRSSSSWRVRWALDYKGLKYIPVGVNLLEGESDREPHLSRNPMGFVPALSVNGEFLVESLAIIEWLEEIHPSPTLLPGDPWQRAKIRALAEIINSGTQPVTNLNVLETISNEQDKRKEWYQVWVSRGLSAYERTIQKTAGKYSFGDQLTMADICLIPQCYGALRYEVDLKSFPLINGIYQRALELSSCQASHPDRFR